MTPLEDPKTLPFYSRVPKEPRKHLAYRRRVIKEARQSRTAQEELWAASKRDVLFFVNMFLWLYEPRPEESRCRIIPFNTYGFQDPRLLTISRNLGKRDVKCEKSRDLGGTYIFLAAIFHDWLFGDLSTFGLVSRDQDAVDQPEDTDTLFWKLDMFLGHPDRAPQAPGLPGWMTPNYDRKSLTLINRDNGSRVFGYAATGDVASGGRKKAMLLDEFAKFKKNEDYAALASTQFVTDCRMFLSTPDPQKGPSGAFYDVIHTPDDAIHIELDWKDHPDRSQGMYMSVRNEKTGEFELEKLDKRYPFKRDYPFVLDGRVRSPYYDKQCKRPGATPRSIAIELDKDYGGATSRKFDIAELEKHEHDCCQSPWCRGRLGWDPESFEPVFEEDPRGPLKLWVQRDPHTGQPIFDKYFFGGDISAGTGGAHSSNSALVGFNSVGVQVAEWAQHDFLPVKWAQASVALCKWFHGAQLRWERNGPGETYTKEILRIRYPHIGYDVVKFENVERETKKAGHFNSDGGESILSEIERAMIARECVIRSKTLTNELKQFVYVNNGKLKHSGAVNPEDDSAAGNAHGDRGIAAAEGWQLVVRRPRRTAPAVEEFPVGSIAHRRRQRELASRAAARW